MQSRSASAASANMRSRVRLLPDDAAELLKRLHSELLNFLKSGGILAGAWGELEAQGENIYLKFNSQLDSEIATEIASAFSDEEQVQPKGIARLK